MSKFDNVKTTAKAAIITIDENGQAVTQMQDVEIPYTRKVEKAATFVKEVLQLDETATVAVISLEHETAQRKQYNIGKLVDFSFYQTTDYEEAKSMEDDGNGNVKMFEVPTYEYTAQLWYTDNTEEPEYFTSEVSYTSHNAYTKGNLRGFIVMRFEEETGNKALGIHNAHRTENGKGYVLVNVDDLPKCERSKRDKF